MRALVDTSHTYEIKIRGYLEASWLDLFEGLTISQEENGITTLSGRLPDQAALHGVLNRISSLGLTLISVNVVPEED